jgi:hypothetical protein
VKASVSYRALCGKVRRYVEEKRFYCFFEASLKQDLQTGRPFFYNKGDELRLLSRFVYWNVILKVPLSNPRQTINYPDLIFVLLLLSRDEYRVGTFK